MSVTWWGHATTTLADAGTRLLTDPVLSRTVAHLRRRRGPVPGPTARQADAALVSHLHLDHLHLPSLRALPVGTPVLVPRGAAALVPGLAACELVELSPGDEVTVGGLGVRAVPAAHDGRRWPWARRGVAPLGFVVTGTRRTWFAGDTDLADGITAAVGPVDVALLPVGGWGPGLGPGHLDAERAARALAEVGARHAVPVHWGTFWPVGLDRVAPQEFTDPGPDLARHAARLAPAATVHVLAPGETVAL